MSGVEIIGLLLGALPLAISAVEHYRVGFDTLKEYSQYENTLKSLRTRLWIQQELFEGTLQCLLREDISESQAKALFPDASLKFDRSLWGSAEIKAKLQRKLDNKYRNFMDVIEEMEMVMRQLMKKLDVDIEEKVKQDMKLAEPLLTPCFSQNGIRNYLRPCCQESKDGNGNGEKFDDALDAKNERISYRNSKGIIPISPNLSNNRRY